MMNPRTAYPLAAFLGLALIIIGCGGGGGSSSGTSGGLTTTTGGSTTGGPTTGGSTGSAPSTNGGTTSGGTTGAGSTGGSTPQNSINLALSGVTGNVNASGITSFGSQGSVTTNSGASFYTAVVNVEPGPNGLVRRRISLGLELVVPLAVGQNFNLDSTNGTASGSISWYDITDTTSFTWRATSGTISVTSISDGMVTVTMNNVVFSALGSSGATGAFTVSGTVSGPQ